MLNQLLQDTAAKFDAEFDMSGLSFTPDMHAFIRDAQITFAVAVLEKIADNHPHEADYARYLRSTLHALRETDN